MSADTGALLCVVACGVLLAVVPAAARGGFGEQCTRATDCTPTHAECINNTCACNSSDVQVRTKCLLPVGAKCGPRSCDADNSKCEDGFCVCIQNYIQTYNNTFCFKQPKYDEYCEKDYDCKHLIEGGICEKNRCRCSATTALDDNKCKKKIDQLGVHCIKETEACYLERDGDNQKVECRNQICTCKEGVTPSKDNMSCGAGALEALSVAASFIALLLAKMLA